MKIRKTPDQRFNLKKNKPYKIISGMNNKVFYGTYLFSRGSWDHTRKVFKLIDGSCGSFRNAYHTYYTITEEKLNNIKIEML